MPVGAAPTRLKLNAHDTALAEEALMAIRKAVGAADAPAAVAKRMTVVAVRYRNQGRKAAIKRHPFKALPA
jgi:hypothetical protein